MTPKQKRIAAFSLMALGFALMAVGLLRGEHRIILQKAIRICMECIGLG